MIRATLLTAFCLALGYGAFEVARWRKQAGGFAISRRQKTIRTWGLICILAALAMWYGGSYLSAPTSGHLDRTKEFAALEYLAYWTVTVLFVLPLIPLALLDYKENIKRAIEEREKLLSEREVFSHMLATQPDSAVPVKSRNGKPAS